jgi:glycosyltransferase involved in cell wall biosynthesis
MKILWFTNGPLPAVGRHLGDGRSSSGHWMQMLLDQLIPRGDLQLEVASVYPGFPDLDFEENGVRYFVLSQPKIPHIFFHTRQRDLDRCAALIRERKPDVVHIHGTERFYGLLAARKMIDCPAVVSIQGLLTACETAFFGALTARDIWKSDRLIELATMRGVYWMQRKFALGARREKEILAGVDRFLGRTEWDRAHALAANPNATYHHVDELLRPPFYNSRWSLDSCDRHTVIFTNVGAPYRGTETLLEAMTIVRRNFPNVRLRLAGNLSEKRGYDHFVRGMISKLDLWRSIDLLGYLKADVMAEQLAQAHVFALPSFVENSPNSLCEAMSVGTPSVSSYTGGIPSLIEQGQSGLMFPPGDAPMLAASIERMFTDNELAQRVSRTARAAALIRHSPTRVVSQLLEAYHDAAGHGTAVYHRQAAS